MTDATNLRRLALVWRYYQAGVVNTLVGFGLFAIFIRLGFNLYAAQICAHLLGMAFNYVSYSRHAFRGSAPSKMRFAVAYAFNYLVSLGMLMAASTVIRSPYLAGLAALACASVINYFVLKLAVFHRPAAL